MLIKNPLIRRFLKIAIVSSNLEAKTDWCLHLRSKETNLSPEK